MNDLGASGLGSSMQPPLSSEPWSCLVSSGPRVYPDWPDCGEALVIGIWGVAGALSREATSCIICIKHFDTQLQASCFESCLPLSRQHYSRAHRIIIREHLKDCMMLSA